VTPLEAFPGLVEPSVQRLLELRNDLGLLAEEFEVARPRPGGQPPHAFSHLALINTAATITAAA
jgi:GH15 family glucan-1,4-alpha-glucosidase